VLHEEADRAHFGGAEGHDAFSREWLWLLLLMMGPYAVRGGRDPLFVDPGHDDEGVWF
jgi:hypothetical protein